MQDDTLMKKKPDASKKKRNKWLSLGVEISVQIIAAFAAGFLTQAGASSFYSLVRSKNDSHGTSTLISMSKRSG